MGIYYLGTFPPPYGGVTVKNKNLFKALSTRLNLKRIDFGKVKRKNIVEVLRFIFAILKRKNRFVVGVSGRRNRKILSGVLYHLNYTAMNHSILVVMGGVAASEIIKDKKYKKYVQQYRKIYVETKGMYNTLERNGIFNVAIYPNGRFAPKKVAHINNNSKLRCVFFSLICLEKGVDIILDVARQMPGVEFTFYGTISKEYKRKFEEIIQSLSNVEYKGLFTGGGDLVYEELSKYDVLLLPTRWKAEGVPGIVVEAKISGIVPILTKINFNRELIKDSKNGFLIDIDDREALSRLISELDKDRNKLLEMKQASIESAKEFFIENYIEDLVASITS